MRVVHQIHQYIVLFLKYLVQHKSTRGCFHSYENMIIKNTCYMCLIHTCLNIDLVLMVMGQMICQILMIKLMTRVGNMMVAVIWSAVNKGIML